jgi:hypothetical protein
MQLDKSLVTTQFTTWWVYKFALRLTWLADYVEVDGITDRIWEIVEEILQSCVREGLWRDNATTRESHSIINYDRLKDKANWQARKADLASS